MHEMSVAMEIRRIAEERLGPVAPDLCTVALEVGDEAGVEPDHLSFCLEAVFLEPPFRGARSEIARVPGDVLRVSYLEVDDGRPDD
ncbi:MAG TPA: hydrogenase/urease maturation nickel metallochaperone HypA [Gemmatimonadales bacterium]|nr:hydrogenase/urease maturation nickel metallochaperone HypA [Gemmatimonadales bacterium]